MIKVWTHVGRSDLWLWLPTWSCNKVFLVTITNRMFSRLVSENVLKYPTQTQTQTPTSNSNLNPWRRNRFHSQSGSCWGWPGLLHPSRPLLRKRWRGGGGLVDTWPGSPCPLLLVPSGTRMNRTPFRSAPFSLSIFPSHYSPHTPPALSLPLPPPRLSRSPSSSTWFYTTLLHCIRRALRLERERERSVQCSVMTYRGQLGLQRRIVDGCMPPTVVPEWSGCR